MAARGLFSLISLILVAAGVMFMFFILLAGATDGYPVNRWYFLEADTSNIPNAPPVARWTYWNICSKVNGRNQCHGDEPYYGVHPAYPLDPVSHRAFHTHVNMPQNFISKHGYYFYMTRFMFAFMLIALFFGVCALFTGLLALCTRLGSYLSSLMTTIALIFQAIQASLMTAAYVKGRNNFRNNGQSAHIGAYAFGFEWAAFACFFLATVFFCLGGGSRREKTTTTTTSKRRFFGRRSKSTRSRGSFIDGNKEYA